MHLRLESFDGPLDVLAHLIKMQEINIFNIPMTLVCQQFIRFLDQVAQLDFVVAGEYLSTAAYLIEIKAAMLLPMLQNTLGEPSSIEDMNQDDPRKPLVAQLLARESLVAATDFLSTQLKIGDDTLPSKESVRRKTELENLPTPILGDPFSLVITWEKILLRFAQKMNGPKVRVRAQKISIQQKMSLVLMTLEELPVFFISQLLMVCENRYELIVTLMATLELAKANQISLFQELEFGEITIEKGELFGSKDVAEIEVE